MELKQPPKRKTETKVSRGKEAGDLSDRLADIELKLDHIIARIRSSLYPHGFNDHGEDEA